MITEIEIAWLSGLLEGEGYFSYDNGTHRITLNMIDEDIVYKVARLFEKITNTSYNPTTVYQEKYNPNSKIYYRLSVCGERARMIMHTIVPHMGYRRRQRIWQSLNKYKAPTKSYRPREYIPLQPLTYNRIPRRF